MVAGGERGFAVLHQGLSRFVHVAVSVAVLACAISVGPVGPAHAVSLSGKPCQRLDQEKRIGSVTFVCSPTGTTLTWVDKSTIPTLGFPRPEDPFHGTRLAGANPRTCAAAWWDKEFGGVIPQLGKTKQSAALTKRIWFHCHDKYGLYMSTARRDAIYREYFRRVGQLVADKVTAVSAATGETPCIAVDEVLSPHLDSRGGLLGWNANSYLPILYKQWQGGPIIGKRAYMCNTGEMLIQFRRHYEGRHEGDYYPPLGTPGATWPLTDLERQVSWVPAGVCLVWSPLLGNTGAAQPPVVIPFTYTNMGGDGVNMFAADNEVVRCEHRAAEAAGLAVTIAPQPNLTRPRAITPEQAGLWHGMSYCAWRLEPADGSPAVQWNPGSEAYTTIELRAGDQFATTCLLHKDSFEHFIVIPEGMFPLYGTLEPGRRRPTTPATCRYAITDSTKLRDPSSVQLHPYNGEPVASDDSMLGAEHIGHLIYSVGCGSWNLV
jgi:hypothetical protein